MNRRLPWAGAGAALVVWMAVLGAGAPASRAPFDVRTTTLKNGLRVVLAPDTLATITQITVCVDAGLGAEPSDQSGIGQIAGLLAGRALPASDADLAALETDPVVTTGPDAFCFETSVAEDLLGRVLEREAARLAGVVHADDVCEAAANDVRAQRAAAAGNAIVSAVTRLYAAAFPGHAYGRPLFGDGRDDGRLTPDAAREHLRKVSSPSNVVVVIAGRFDARAALAKARASFESLPARRAPAHAAPPGGAVASRDTLRIAGPSLLVAGWRGPAARDADAAAFEVLARAISSGPQSRIAQNLLTDAKLFARAEGHLDVRHDASILFGVAIPAQGADRTAVEDRMFAVAEFLAGTPLEAETLERARAQAETGLLMRLHPMRGRARALAMAELGEGGAAGLSGRIAAIRRVSAADVQRVAAKFLQPSRRLVVWTLPPKGETGGQP